jgi:hypothetical protein
MDGGGLVSNAGMTEPERRTVEKGKEAGAFGAVAFGSSGFGRKRLVTPPLDDPPSGQVGVGVGAGGGPKATQTADLRWRNVPGATHAGIVGAKAEGDSMGYGGGEKEAGAEGESEMAIGRRASVAFETHNQRKVCCCC